tara:strand:+ start:8200 stop:9216 length:1017 start_codon:yes stop_codon:yes gene_type:complete
MDAKQLADDWLRIQGPDKCDLCCDVENGGDKCLSECKNGIFENYNLKKCFACSECNGGTFELIDADDEECTDIPSDYIDTCFQGKCRTRGEWKDDAREKVKQCMTTQKCFNTCYDKARERGACKDIPDAACQPKNFMGIGRTKLDSCLNKCKNDDTSGFFEKCKCLGGTKDGDWRLIAAYSSLGVFTLGLGIYAGAFSAIGKASGLVDLPITLVEVGVDEWLSRWQNKVDSRRRADKVKVYQEIENQRNHHIQTLQRLSRKQQVTQEELFDVFNEIEKLKRQAAELQPTIASILSETDLKRAKVIYEQRKKDNELDISTAIVFLSIVVIFFLFLRWIF